MFEDNAITHSYSGRFTTSVSASRADYSISDGSSFGSELSVEFVGNTLFSVRGSKFSSANYSNQLNTSYRVGASQSLFSKRLSNKVYQDFSSGGSSGVTSSSSSGGGVGASTSSGGGSFISIHNEVQSGMSVPGIGGGITSIGKDYGGKPGGKPTDSPIGQKDPLVPVGDALIPMLLMIAVYAIVRFFSSRKKLQTINQSVNK